MEDFDWYIVTLRDPDTLRTSTTRVYAEDSNDAWGDAAAANLDLDVVSVRMEPRVSK